MIREPVQGMGRAVAERTVLRKVPDGNGGFRFETWAEVAERVARGNVSLLAGVPASEEERLRALIGKGAILLSGRHLQHGDETQKSRPQEVYTNCFEGSTRILTIEYGPIEIEKISGRTVTVISGDGKPRPAVIYDHGEQDIFEITFRVFGSGGKIRHTVKATANHRWKLHDGRITDRLAVGDVIAALPCATSPDREAVVHGIVFGDGGLHKRAVYSDRVAMVQGRGYVSLRVCKRGDTQREMHEILDKSGYPYRITPYSNGDRIYYFGASDYLKDLPFTTDPDYIDGFIYGWWLADGCKELNGSLEISTSNERAVAWLFDHCAYAGYNVTSYRVMERKVGDGSFDNGKSLHVIRLRRNVEWKVESIEPAGKARVFCPEEPVTGLFVLANGLLTGNCSTAAASFISFYLLLNGSGVGRCYDPSLMVVDWDDAPALRCVLDHEHPDFDWSAHESVRDAKHKYSGPSCYWHEVEDSREGWAKAVELWETMAYQRVYRRCTLVLDFSKVRPKGSPIRGMQNRPASGPVPLMNALQKCATVRGAGMPPWKQALYIDHYLAECVLVGGARRSARMAVMNWRHPEVLDFIQVKRPIEFNGLSVQEIIEYRQNLRKQGRPSPLGFLWSANNSVIVDQDFWQRVDKSFEILPNTTCSADYAELPTRLRHARRVFDSIVACSYADGTGEPGVINGDKLVFDITDLSKSLSTVENYVGSERYRVTENATKRMLQDIARLYLSEEVHTKAIVNPCSEIVLSALGGYCVIGDVAPYLADDIEEFVEAVRLTTRALIRVNTMDCLYGFETDRTNRIGVSLTGVFEFAWKEFRVGFRDLIACDPKGFVERWRRVHAELGDVAFDVLRLSEDSVDRATAFWFTLARAAEAAQKEAERYAEEIGTNVPHTVRTIKPAGTTSKLYGLCEGWHLPAMRRYLRWVQFRNDDPLVEEYRKRGYPTKELRTYSGTTIVGFPTETALVQSGIPDELIVTATEATPEEQYRWLELGEFFWIVGVDSEGDPLVPDRGNQISYTLKLDTNLVSFDSYREILRTWQRRIRCCSVLPVSVEDLGSYEYLPEEAISKAEYEKLAAAIERDLSEDVGREHLQCDTGACPIDFKESK